MRGASQRRAQRALLDSVVRWLQLIATALALLILGSAASLAHRPYFTQIEPTVLPDGNPGEMRLLNGDGIFFADPTRIVVLDQNKQVLARSPRTAPLSLICDSARRSCWGYDHNAGQALILDPSSFRMEGKPLLGDDDENELGRIESGDESWGFTVRDASWAEYVEAEWTLAQRMAGSMFFLAALGIVLACLAVVGVRIPSHGSKPRLLLWVAGLMVRAICAVTIAIIALYVAVLHGLSLTIWLVGLGAGVAPILLLWGVLRRNGVAAA